MTVLYVMFQFWITLSSPRKAKEALRSSDVLIHVKIGFGVERPDQQSSWYFLVAKPYFRPYLMILCCLTPSADSGKLKIIDHSDGDGENGDGDADANCGSEFDDGDGDAASDADANRPPCEKRHEMCYRDMWSFLTSRKLCFNLLKRDIVSAEVAVLDYATDLASLNVLILKDDINETAHVPVPLCVLDWGVGVWFDCFGSSDTDTAIQPYSRQCRLCRVLKG